MVVGRSHLTVDTAAQICIVYGLKSGWLLAGDGAGPKAATDPESAGLMSYGFQWAGLVASLGIYQTDREAHDALVALPNATSRMSVLLASAGADAPAVTPELRRIGMREYKLWMAWLDEWIAAAGRDVIHDALSGRTEEIRLLSGALYAVIRR